MVKYLIMAVHEIKKQITKKYRNIRRFCEITGLGYYSFQSMTRGDSVSEKNINKLEQLMEENPNRMLANELTPKTRRLIKSNIYSKYKNVTAFCIKTGISDSTVSMVISGATIKITPLVEKICNTLKINIDERS